MMFDEVRKMTDKELRGTAWELLGGCWGEDAPDYPHDWTPAMELFEAAREDAALAYRMYYALGRLTGGLPLNPWQLYKKLTPHLVTEAFVIAGSKEA